MAENIVSLYTWVISYLTSSRINSRAEWYGSTVSRVTTSREHNGNRRQRYGGGTIPNTRAVDWPLQLGERILFTIIFAAKGLYWRKILFTVFLQEKDYLIGRFKLSAV